MLDSASGELGPSRALCVFRRAPRLCHSMPPDCRLAVQATDGGSQKKGQSPNHRRTFSTTSDMARAVGINIAAVSMAEARKIMSEEHKILGFRPLHSSFAANVQTVASKHPEGKPDTPVDTTKLREIAREDALRILAEHKTSPGMDCNAPSGLPTTVGAAKAVQDGGGGEGGERKH